MDKKILVEIWILLSVGLNANNLDPGVKRDKE